MSDPSKVDQVQEAAPEAAPDRTKEFEARTEQAERVAEAAGRQAAWAAGAAQAAMSSRQAPQQPRIDPLEILTRNELVMSPEEKKMALRAAIEEGAAQRSAATERRLNFEMERRQRAMEAASAIETTKMLRPDIADPRNVAAFGGAMAKAKFEAEARGENLSYQELVGRGVTEYDKLYPKSRPAAAVPYVEGGFQPNGQPMGQVPPGPPVQSQLEKLYGIKAGIIKETPAADDWSDVTLDYLRQKNERLLGKGGFKTDMAEVLYASQPK